MHNNFTNFLSVFSLCTKTFKLQYKNFVCFVLTKKHSLGKKKYVFVYTSAYVIYEWYLFVLKMSKSLNMVVLFPLWNSPPKSTSSGWSGWAKRLRFDRWEGGSTLFSFTSFRFCSSASISLTIIEFTTCFHEFSEYESTNFFTAISQVSFLSFDHLRKSKQIHALCLKSNT